MEDVKAGGARVRGKETDLGGERGVEVGGKEAEASRRPYPLDAGELVRLRALGRAPGRWNRRKGE